MGELSMNNNLKQDVFNKKTPATHAELLRSAGKIVEKRLGRELCEEDIAKLDTFLSFCPYNQGNAFKRFMNRKENA